MSKLPNVPSELEGRSLGPANSNESVGPEDRSGEAKTEKLSDGPNMLDTGAYGPARYKTRERTVIGPQGQSAVVDGNIREDR